MQQLQQWPNQLHSFQLELILLEYDVFGFFDELQMMKELKLKPLQNF